MALVNPNIAMSYRPTVEYQPRNALAEAAQIQQIMGGQRQAEMANMQMEDLRREREALGRIQAAIVAKGGPPDLGAAADEMIRTGRPQFVNQGMAIRESLKKQRYFDEYERLYGGGAGAPTTPTSAAGAITGAAPAAAEPVKSTDFDMRSHVEEKGTPESPFIEVMPYESSPTSTQRRAQGKSQAELRGMLQSESESGRPLVRYVNPMDSASGRVFSYSMPTTTNPFLAEPLPPFEPTSEPAPAAAVQTNALAPTAPPANLNQLAAAGGAAPDIDALMRRYNLASKAGSPDAAVLLKQIEAALRGDQNKPITVSQGQVVIDPRTGRQIFAAPAAPIAPRIDVIGVAKGTDTPVYFDKDTRQQFTIGVDASGKQAQVPYTGAVNRSTSNVTATATSAGSRLESAEQKGKGELNVKQYGEIASAARLAARTLPAIETQAKILDQGFKTGFGTDVKKAGASVLAALGVPEAERFATDAQTFIAATQQAVLQKQLEQKGVQTQADADRITQTGAQLGNTINANRFIVDVAKAQLQRDIDQRNFYDNWWSKNKTYEGAESAWYAGEGAEDAWYASEGGKSLFDRPALKKYLAPAQGAAAAGAAPAIPQAAINDLKAGRGTDAQFDAIFGAGAAKRAREGK
jgi:hypothetical protein